MLTDNVTNLWNGVCYIYYYIQTPLQLPARHTDVNIQHVLEYAFNTCVILLFIYYMSFETWLEKNKSSCRGKKKSIWPYAVNG